MTRTIVERQLLAEGDRVLVAVSGGKDSCTLADLLARLQRRAPIRFELVAVHLDQRQPGHDSSALAGWLAGLGIPFEIVRRDTYAIVKRRIPAGKTGCSLCSRLRRGILYTTARRLGCNKIALGHHGDDALETLLLNLFYAGKLQAMPASYGTADGRFQVIRPLIECLEADIRRHAATAGYPVLACGVCGTQPDTRREAMTALIDRLERRHPDVRNVMLNALGNVRPSHLLDRQLEGAVASEPVTASGVLDGHRPDP